MAEAIFKHKYTLMAWKPFENISSSLPQNLDRQCVTIYLETVLKFVTVYSKLSVHLVGAGFKVTILPNTSAKKPHDKLLHEASNGHGNN